MSFSEIQKINNFTSIFNLSNEFGYMDDKKCRLILGRKHLHRSGAITVPGQTRIEELKCSVFLNTLL